MSGRRDYRRYANTGLRRQVINGFAWCGTTAFKPAQDMSLEILSSHGHPLMKALAFCLLLPFLCLLTACEQLGFSDQAKQAEAKDAEGKAIGGACRHAGRALEDCYALNPAAIKASIFAGWKDMNDYMAQNKIETVKPELPPALPAAKPDKADTTEAEASAPAETPPAKSSARKRAAKADSGAY